MSVKNEFSKHAKEYNSYNIIQQIAAKSLIRELKSEPNTILELGCGTGQIFKHITWSPKKYTAIDFSSSMCALHPKASNVDIHCLSFDSDEFYSFLQGKKYDQIISSSALQWSKDLTKIVKALRNVSDKVDAVLFTSNTFKTIQKITNNKSPILGLDIIKSAFSSEYNCDFEVYNYNLEFDNKKDIFEYIKKSGVSGGKALDFKSAKKLYREYDLNYLEFEVVFIKATI